MSPNAFRMNLLAGAVAALLVTAAHPSPLHGQRETDAREPARLVGVVVDAGSGVAIPGAAILLDDRARPVFADRHGRFTLEGVRPGTHAVTVAQLGYDTLRTRVEVEEVNRPVALRLTADPVVLERVTAMVDRFRERLNSMGTSVRSFDQLGLRSAPSQTALDFVLTRTSLVPAHCPSLFAFSPCAYVRGRPTEVQVYVDGARIVAGLDVLATYRPEELYSLDVISGGRAILAYTNWYVESVARGRRVPVVLF